MLESHHTMRCGELLQLPSRSTFIHRENGRRIKKTRTALSKAHISAKVSDVTKVLRINKRRVTLYPPMRSMEVPSPNRNVT